MRAKNNVIIYSTSWCGPCASAKRLLSERGIAFTEIDIEEQGMSREDLFEVAGGRTVPQIIIDEKPIGGYDDLVKLDSNGLLIA
jgi:glutaredoxin